MDVRSPADEPGRGARLVVLGPAGERLLRVALSGKRVTVGRLAEANDIALQPDPELFVSRSAHCVFERQGQGWLVVDGGSVNGTYLRHAGVLRRVEGRAGLVDGDVVCVLASVAESGERRFFELGFRQSEDAQVTRAAPATQAPAAECLAYDDRAERLVLVRGAERHEIRLRPQGHRLVRHMAARNAGAAPALCTHDELMQAVWADEPLHTRTELARLVWELRRELRAFGAEHLVESEPRRGYRLATCPNDPSAP